MTSIRFQSTLPVWGATTCTVQGREQTDISIHAPRVGSDGPSAEERCAGRDFNPRSPCGERPGRKTSWRTSTVFQSTLPVWGATGTPRISSPVPGRFQSTLPVWGATLHLIMVLLLFVYFNPRSPCGERPRPCWTSGSWTIFQSTLPVWGATCSWQCYRNSTTISIHAPRVGSDAYQVLVGLPSHPFQSTLPVWGATAAGRSSKVSNIISIHAPRVGSDDKQDVVDTILLISIHAPRVGSDHMEKCFYNAAYISIHAPRVGSDQRLHPRGR